MLYSQFRDNLLIKKTKKYTEIYKNAQNDEEKEIEKVNNFIDNIDAKYVTDGLILFFDATNKDSFKEQDTWKDLSGQENDFKLYNSPEITEEGIKFNCLNQYAKSISKIDLTNIESVTVEVRYKSEDTSRVAMLFEHTSNWNNVTGGFGLAINSDGYNSRPNRFHTNHNSQRPRNYTKEINNDISTHTNIYSSVAKINGRLTYIDSIKMQYIDSFGTDNQTSSGQFTNDYMFIASRNGTESFLNGTIMSVRVYNRALTEEEIISNYNADLFMN